MNILVYGVHNWDNKDQPQRHIDHCHEWYNRIQKFIPNVKKVMVATGNYCNPQYSPFPKEVQIVQNGIQKTYEYSRRYQYFRNGFVSGIWHTLLNEKDWDILFHIQGRVLIGESLEKELNSFFNSDSLVMAPKFTQYIGSSIEISIMAMKQDAVKEYAVSPVRTSFNKYNLPDVNCEEEAYIMFNNSWYNPWKKIITTRQLDNFYDDNGEMIDILSPFAILDKEYIKKLPFISVGKKHINYDYYNYWKECHPC